MIRTPKNKPSQVEGTYDWGQTKPKDAVRETTAKTPSGSLTTRQIKARLTESYKRKKEAKAGKGPGKGSQRGQNLGESPALPQRKSVRPQ